MPAGSSCSQMESRCHRSSGRFSVRGVHGVERRYPGIPVFKQLLSTSELARRCQSRGPCPPKGGTEEDDGTTGLLACPGRRRSRVFVFMTGLSLELRDSCVVSTLWQRPGCRRSRVQGCFEARVLGRARVQPPMVKAHSGFDGPVGVAAMLCRELKTLMPWL